MQVYIFLSVIPSYVQPTLLRFSAFRSLHPRISDQYMFLFSILGDSVLIGFYIPGRISTTLRRILTFTLKLHRMLIDDGDKQLTRAACPLS
jgi:hypothetical protein